jgi:ribosome-associated protein
MTHDVDDTPPSRSARKREAEALQALGLRLAQLSERERRRLPLEPALAIALDEYRSITSNGAKRRQLQYIGRLMREIDTAALEEALAEIDGRSAASRFRQHELERWRTALIEGDAALTDYVGRYPHTDVRRLRTLLRDARLAPGPVQVRAFRELFAYLRQNEEAHRQE